MYATYHRKKWEEGGGGETMQSWNCLLGKATNYGPSILICMKTIPRYHNDKQLEYMYMNVASHRKKKGEEVKPNTELILSSR